MVPGRIERIAADGRRRKIGREAVRRPVEVGAADDDEVLVIRLDVADHVVPGLRVDVRRKIAAPVVPHPAGPGAVP